MYLALLYIYFTWLALQNFLLPLAYQHGWLSAGLVVALMGVKEAVMMLALLALGYRAFQKGWRFNAADKFALAYAVLLLLYFAFAPLLLGATVPFFVRIVSLRYLIALVVFYFWGRLSYLELGELRKVIRFVVGLQVAVALFGIFEWTFLPISFWSETVGAGNFLVNIKGLIDGYNVIDGLVANMYRFDIRRLVSTYADPLSMGVACVFPLLLCVAWLLHKTPESEDSRQRRRWWVAGTIIAVALVLTIGRESIGAAALGIVLLTWWCGKSKQLVIPVALIGCVVALLPSVWANISDTFTFKEDSASVHLRFIENGWEKVPQLLVGQGLGESGGWAFSLAGKDSGVGEDSYFELMSQAGLLSVLLLIGFLVSILRNSLWYSRRCADPLIAAVFLAAAANIVSRSLFSVFSGALFGVIPMASFLFLCGASFTTMQRAGVRPGFVLRKAFIRHQPLAHPGAAAGVAQ